MQLKPIIYKADLLEIEKKVKAFKSISKHKSKLWHFIQTKGTTETKVQQECKKIFEGLATVYSKELVMDFMQIDNGGNLSIGGKMKKKAEGTIKGASDVIIWIAKKHKPETRQTFLVEFKRVGVPSEVRIKEEQIEFQKRWKECYAVEGIITNNIAYFENWLENLILKFILNK